MKTFQTTLLIAILWLMTANSTTYAYDPADFLPLAVGNSWTYLHTYALVAEYLSPEEIGDIDIAGITPDAWNTIECVEIDGKTRCGGSLYQEEMVTITITHTEEIEGHTYYVFDVPHHRWPLLYYFLAGKRVRFEGGKLMEWEEGEEICLYDFSPELPGITSPEIISNAYPIPEHEGDTFVRRFGPSSLARISFSFEGHPDGKFYEGRYEGRTARFQEGQGISFCGHDISPEDISWKINFLELKSTILKPSSIHPTNWSFIKQLFSKE